MQTHRWTVKLLGKQLSCKICEVDKVNIANDMSDGPIINTSVQLTLPIIKQFKY